MKLSEAAALAAAASDNAEPQTWRFEDAIDFVEDTMPLLSFLPAAAIGFYFGSQPGKSVEEPN